MKAYLCLAVGTIGAAVAQFFGGWSDCLTVLLILMAIDYVSGLLLAGVFHKSPKTESGAIESRVGLKGLVRKIAVVCIVVVAHLIDRLLGTNYVRDATAIAFCVNEVLSIIENVGLMGVPMPKVLTKALEVLRQKAGDEEKVDSGQGTVDSEEESDHADTE